MKIYGNFSQTASFGTLKYDMKRDPQDKLAKYAQYYKTSEKYHELTQQIKDSGKEVILSDDYDEFISARIKGSNEQLQGPVMKVLDAVVKRISPDYQTQEQTKTSRARKRF